MAVLHRDMRIVSKEPTDGLWFKHESHYDLNSLNPVSYELLKSRKGDVITNMRRHFDSRYRTILPHHPDYTFLFATVVGANMMEDPLLHTGYTYYFRLPDVKIEQCVFTIIDDTKWMEPTVGAVGLNKALEIWSNFNQLFSRPRMEGLELVYPRIEVVIPFAVKPDQVIPQYEDR